MNSFSFFATRIREANLGDPFEFPLEPRAREAQAQRGGAETRLPTRKEPLKVVSRAPEGKHLPENPLPSDHVILLNGEGDANRRYVGLRRLGNNPNQTSETFRSSSKVAVGHLLSWVDQMAGEEKVYISQADFFWGPKNDKDRHRTTTNYLKSIGTVFVDLDIYSDKEDSSESEPGIEGIAALVLQTCEKNGIPAPLLISSGRGLYAEWILDKRLNLRHSDSATRWKSIQRRLIGALHEFGPDKKVTDITRVLRLIGTRNEKNGSLVRVVYDDGARYSLRELEIATEHLSDYALIDQVEAPKKRLVAKRVCERIESEVQIVTERAENSIEDIQTESLKNAQEDLEPVDPSSLQWLDALIESDAPRVAELGKLRLRNYRMFEDIARVVQMRKGIDLGDRDEFQFWMLVCRFNAGMLLPSEMPDLAEKLSLLTVGRLDIWKSGMLSTLYSRMTRSIDQRAEQFASQNGIEKKQRAHVIIKRMGAFSAEIQYTPKPFVAGGDRSRPLVYTPSAATLVSKLGLTVQEQAGLHILVGQQEKNRRRRSQAASTILAARNKEVRAAYKKGASIEDISAQFGISRATAYRALSNLTKQTGKPSKAPEKKRDNAFVKNVDMKALRKEVRKIRKQNPQASIRELSAMSGVPASSIYRWETADRRKLAEAIEQDRKATQNRAEMALCLIATNEQKSLADGIEFADKSKYISLESVLYQQSNLIISCPIDTYDRESKGLFHNSKLSHVTPHTMERCDAGGMKGGERKEVIENVWKSFRTGLEDSGIQIDQLDAPWMYDESDPRYLIQIDCSGDNPFAEMNDGPRNSKASEYIKADVEYKDFGRSLEAAKTRAIERVRNSGWGHASRQIYIKMVTEAAPTSVSRDRKMLLIGNKEVKDSLREFYKEIDALIW